MPEKKNITSTYLKVGDNVQIKVGKYKGLTGFILILNKKKLIAQVNFIKPSEKLSKGVKQNESNENSSFKKNSHTSFIHISNLMLWDEKSKKSSRIGYRIVDNKKVRYLKKSNKII